MKKKTGIARLFEIAGEKKALLIVASLLGIISSLLMLVPYWSVYEVMKELLYNSSDIKAVDGDLLIHWAWIALGSLGAGVAVLYASLMASHVAAFKILYGLRVKVSKHIGKLSLGYLNGTSTGAIKKIMEQSIEKVEVFIAHQLPDLISVISTIVFMFVICLSLSGWLSLVCFVCVIISLAIQILSFTASKNAKEMTKRYYDVQEEMSASAVQYVRGIPVVKVFGQSLKSFKHFHNEILNYGKWALKVCDNYQGGMVAFTIILNSILMFILPTGLLLISKDPSNIALAAAWLFFLIIGSGLTTPIFKLMYLGSATQEINVGVERIDRIFDEKPLPETSSPQKPTSYDIKFENVSFAYLNTQEATRTEALKNISFTAWQGEITALVGPSGSGKSTVANLIPRFWDVAEGRITIGGINIKDIATEELMNTVSFVFQDTFLFSDTLYENIAVGNPSATMDSVIEAAKAAQCHDFISKLPKGYDTKIGEDGTFLSGGEAQRVAVARAILKNSPILVLDEATAFADPENEQKMQAALKELINNKTVIIIAHRLSSIISAKQIIVLNEGQLIQSGRHEKLSTTEGLYKNMWDAYTKSFEWELEN